MASSKEDTMKNVLFNLQKHSTFCKPHPITFELKFYLELENFLGQVSKTIQGEIADALNSAFLDWISKHGIKATVLLNLQPAQQLMNAFATEVQITEVEDVVARIPLRISLPCRCCSENFTVLFPVELSDNTCNLRISDLSAICNQRSHSGRVGRGYSKRSSAGKLFINANNQKIITKFKDRIEWTCVSHFFSNSFRFSSYLAYLARMWLQREQNIP
jgi:hypothetical protein